MNFNINLNHILFSSISTKTKVSYANAALNSVYTHSGIHNLTLIASKRHVSAVDAALVCGAKGMGSSLIW